MFSSSKLPGCLGGLFAAKDTMLRGCKELVVVHCLLGFCYILPLTA